MTSTIPTVETSDVTEITGTTAVSGGRVIVCGGPSVVSRGVCWSTAENPTITDSKTMDGKNIGSFRSALTRLSANTTYYVKAFATNSIGTAYGIQKSFTTSR